MIMKTICLKLHKPSAIKRVIIDKALSDYNEAFDYLLEEANKEPDSVWDEFEDSLKRFTGDRLSKWVDSTRSRELNKFNVEPFKDSIKMDFGATYSGYLNKRRLRLSTGLPGTSKGVGCKTSLRQRPLLYCRYSQNRDYCLLYNRESNKYYAKLYLMNNKSDLKRQATEKCGKKLYYICKNGEVFEERPKKVRYLLIPLSFGAWQENYLKMGLSKPEIFKTARLVKKGNNYYLYINIKLDTPEEVSPISYLGISRSLKNPIHTSLVELSGNLIKSSPINLSDNKNSAVIPIQNSLNIIANQVIKYAVKNKSQIVVENLADKSDRLNWSGKDKKEHSAVLSSGDYRRLVDIIKYKALENALPKVISVSPVGVFYTCPQCGLNSKKNRLSHNMFLCTKCGYASAIDDLGSFNVACKVLKYKNDSIKIKAEVSNGGVIFRLEQLDFECFLKEDADVMENLKKRLKMKIEDLEKETIHLLKDKRYNIKYSIIKKLKEQPDILDNVEVIVVTKDIT